MATYYVRKSGNDSTGTGATGTPWLTINKGLDAMAGGDTLIVGDGTYAESGLSPKSGSSGSWTTVRAENRHLAIIAAGAHIFTVGTNYVEIDGFRFNLSSSGGCQIQDCHHVAAKNLRIVGGTMHGVMCQRGDFFTVENCEISGQRYDNFWSAISIYQARNVSSDTTTLGYRNIIRNNYTWDNTQTSGTKTDGNGIILDDFQHTQGGTGQPVYPFKTLVEGNICTSSGSKGIQVTWTNFATVRFNTTFLNNTDTTNTGTWAADLSNQVSDHNSFYNNIAVSTTAVRAYLTAIGHYTNAAVGATGDGRGTDFFNNISYNLNSGSDPALHVEGGVAKGPISGNGNQLPANPLMTDPDDDGTGDFTLQSGSPARDAGRVSWLVDPEDCRVSGTNTAQASWVAALPEYESGDLIVGFVASDANVTHDWPGTAPNGETITSIVDSHGDTTTATVRVSAFRWVATAKGLSTATLTITPSATEQWVSTFARIRAGRFNAGAPIDSSATAANSSGTATTVASPAWSVTNSGCAVLAWMGVDDDPITNVASGWTNIKSTDVGAVTGTLAVRTALTSASESVAAASWAIAGDSSAVIGIAIRDCVAVDIRPATDRAGTSRTAGSVVDIGALEFSSGSTTVEAAGTAGGTGAAAGDGLAVGGPLFASTVLSAAGYQDSALTSPPALVGDLDDANPDSPDSLWWTPVAAGAQADIRLGFATPATLTGPQRFKVRVRPTSGSGTPAVSVSLYESGALVRELLSDVPVTVEATLEADWDTSELTDETGAGVEIRIVSENGAPANLVVNGVFAADTDWSKTAGWTIGSGIASCSAAASALATLQQTISSLDEVSTYRVSFDATWSSGYLHIYLGTSQDAAAQVMFINATGSYSDDVMVPAGHTKVISFVSDFFDGFVGSVDNVSVVQL